MAILNRAAVALVLSGLAGCDILRAPTPLEYTEDSVAVYALLQAGADTVRVSLVRFDSRATLLEQFTPLSGAEVRIVQDGDTTRLAEAPTGFTDCFRNPSAAGAPPAIRSGCYAARLAQPIRAGEQYRLHVLLPEGGSILGSATVPHPPGLRRPEEGSRVEIPATPASGIRRPGTLRVAWTAPPGAERIEVGVAVAALYRNGQPLPGSTCRVEVAHPPAEELVRLDSVTLAVLPPDCLYDSKPAEWDSLVSRLVVTAYDSAYARYAREALGGGSVRKERAGAGVVGAFGFFGAAAQAERGLVLVPAARP